MKTWTKALCLAAIMTGLAFAPAVQACTGIRLKAEDGSIITARTGEFGAPLDARLIIIPRGFSMSGGPVEEAEPKQWTSKYGVVGVNFHGAPPRSASR